jgi:hypothetical protein
MVARARLRGIDSVIPAKYRGVSFDRPPVTQMNEIVVRRVREYCASITEQLDAGRAWALRQLGHRKDHPGDARLADHARGRPLGRDLLAAEAAVADPPHLRRGGR